MTSSTHLYTWQGTDASQFPDGPRTLLEAMLRRGRDVRYVAGSTFSYLARSRPLTMSTISFQRLRTFW